MPQALYWNDLPAIHSRNSTKLVDVVDKVKTAQRSSLNAMKSTEQKK